MTKSCRSCTQWSSKQNEPGYEKWKVNHVFPINHESSSSSMESEGALKFFHRSLEKYHIRYVNYIGDGDSSAFAKVAESNPYPGKSVNKLECIGHIQKRVGSNLIKLSQQHSFMKGRGERKLTKKVINTLQNYYGMAIRSSRQTIITQMKMAIAAVLCHCVRKVVGGVEDLGDRPKVMEPGASITNLFSMKVNLKVIELTYQKKYMRRFLPSGCDYRKVHYLRNAFMSALKM